MLDSPEIAKIEKFVYSKPRSIQEIAQHLNKNWRTADRYILEIEKNFGTIATRTFREGTRGALKIVYWASMEKISSSVFQEEMEKEIMLGKNKFDFSPFDIFMHVLDRDKKARVFDAEKDEDKVTDEMNESLNKADKQLLLFSGNLSLINEKTKNTDTFKTLEALAKKGVTIKILTRVDLMGKENIQKVESINHRLGKEAIEIRHRHQPIRGAIIDGKFARIKEVTEPTRKADAGSNGKNRASFETKDIMYIITNKEWIEWLTKIFWKMFSNSVSAEKRLTEINKLKTFTE